MKCPQCKTDVKDNADYSQHMNKSHRGMSYQNLSMSTEKKDTVSEKHTYKTIDK